MVGGCFSFGYSILKGVEASWRGRRAGELCKKDAGRSAGWELKVWTSQGLEDDGPGSKCSADFPRMGEIYREPPH